jgi:hypothetical protein
MGIGWPTAGRAVRRQRPPVASNGRRDDCRPCIGRSRVHGAVHRTTRRPESRRRLLWSLVGSHRRSGQTAGDGRRDQPPRNRGGNVTARGQAAKKTSENLRWLALSACAHDGSRRAPREQGVAPAGLPPDGLPGAMTRMISDKKLQPFSCSSDDAGRCEDAAAREPVMNFLEGSRKRFPMQRRRRDDFAAIFTNATRGRADAHPERLADVPHSGSLTAEHSARRRGWGASAQMRRRRGRGRRSARGRRDKNLAWPPWLQPKGCNFGTSAAPMTAGCGHATEHDGPTPGRTDDDGSRSVYPDRRSGRPRLFFNSC